MVVRKLITYVYELELHFQCSLIQSGCYCVGLVRRDNSRVRLMSNIHDRPSSIPSDRVLPATSCLQNKIAIRRHTLVLMSLYGSIYLLVMICIYVEHVISTGFL